MELKFQVRIWSGSKESYQNSGLKSMVDGNAYLKKDNLQPRHVDHSVNLFRERHCFISKFIYLIILTITEKLFAGFVMKGW